MEKIKPKKRLGQHFLKDRKIIEKISDSLHIGKEDLIVEIGAGTGALTEELLKRNPEKLIAIEIDSELCEFLKEKFSNYKNFFHFSPFFTLYQMYQHQEEVNILLP